MSRRVYKFIDEKYGLEAIRRRRLKVSEFTALNDPFEGKCVDFPNGAFRAAWDKTRNEFSSRHGIISFSNYWSNPVLWSHYANNHQGLALGFDLEENINLHTVQYQPTLIPFSDYDPNSPDRWKFARRVFTTKFEHWKYESEVRAFVDLEDRDPLSGYYFLEFSSDMKIKEVIFGAHFNPESACKLRSYLSSTDRVKFTTARLAFKTFSVVTQKYKKKQL